MSTPSRSNHRAACFPLVLLGVLLLPVVPALGAGHLYDPSGVSGDLFGQSATLLEDINGDGYDELIVGAPGVAGGSGRILFWWGGPWTYVAPDFTRDGTGGEGFGWCVAAVGDVNGGGKADLAVGAPNYGTDTGRVYLFYGETIAAGGLGLPDRTLTGAAANDGFGFSIAAVGDFDDDTDDDFIVGAPDPRALADASSKAGKAYVIFGASGGPSTSLGNALVLTAGGVNGRFGWSVAGVGNFLGGSVPSVAVGAPLVDTFGLNAGAVYVYEGGSSPDAVVDHTVHSGAANVAEGWYGYAVASAGRWDGDSIDDLVVGAPYNRVGASLPGRVEIVFGGNSPSLTGDRYAAGALADDEFGFSVAGVGDAGGSSADDVMIGAPRNDEAGTDAGQAYLWTGGSASQVNPGALDTYQAAPDGGAPAGDLYGTWVAGGGDFDGDGLVDVMAGAPVGNPTTGGPTAGYLHLIHSSTGPVANELQSWRADWLSGQDDARVELAFALAAPASRIARLTVARNTLDAGGRVRDVAQVFAGAPGEAGLVVGADSYVCVDRGPFAIPAGGSLSYDVTATTDDGSTLQLKSLAGPAGAAPVFGLAIRGPHPNPSSAAQTTVAFRARAGDPVEVTVFDLRGRVVRQVYAGAGTGAWQDARWDLRDDQGATVAAGVYHLVVTSPEGRRSTRVSLMR